MKVSDRVDIDLLDTLATFTNVRLGEMHTVEDIAVAAGKWATSMPVPPVRDDVVIENLEIPGVEAEGTIRLRVYRPAGAPVSEGLPCLYWIHGGGMIMGSPEQDDFLCQEYVGRAGCVVVSVDYRLAPTYPFPGGLNDCYTGLEWLSTHAAELGVDSRRIAVGGASAGGGLAAALTLYIRDHGGPSVVFQQLIYPMLDDRNTTPSSREFIGNTVVWSRENNVAAWNALLQGKAGGEDVSTYAAPARATDLANLPPAYIHVGELDLFRDEDVDYAIRLLQAGVATELHVHPGAIHGWDVYAPNSEGSQRALRDLIDSFIRSTALERV
ncbi:alpha/beta hydrolase [Rhodococcus pyridinivorans]|uniref:Alpha/beta hydrolase n=1 Tax=Rhodococcus pyridinivorans TaxID=103816 RepID=A0A7M2XW61_9NOCA|nr:alpha/beta hydrolase [Rhodococcus pyridinivorans]QOW01838.1 alpha/beta hydrolase [Rhodococcus pyridinivorans]